MNKKPTITPHHGSIKYMDYERRLETYHQTAQKEFSKKNFELIKKYDSVLVGSSASISFRAGTANQINLVTRLLDKNWNELTKDDVDNLVIAIMKKYGNHKGQESATTHTLKNASKVFLRWIKLGSRIYRNVGDPPEVRDIHMKKIHNKITKDMLVTDKDRANLITACTGNLRNQAFIDVICDAGPRAGEILTLQIKHVKHDSYGLSLAVDGKTGARPIRLIKSVGRLTQWINSHPFADDPEAPLWIILKQPQYGQPLKYSSANAMLRHACKNAHVNKRIFLHLFRHSSATESAKYMKEAELKIMYGWEKSSNMPSIYVHLADDDVDKTRLKHFGIITEEPDDQQIPIKCKCGEQNSHDTDWCVCGRAVSRKAHQERKAQQKKDDEKHADRILELAKQKLLQGEQGVNKLGIFELVDKAKEMSETKTVKLTQEEYEKIKHVLVN